MPATSARARSGRVVRRRDGEGDVLRRQVHHRGAGLPRAGRAAALDRGGPRRRTSTPRGSRSSGGPEVITTLRMSAGRGAVQVAAGAVPTTTVSRTGCPQRVASVAHPVGTAITARPMPTNRIPSGGVAAGQRLRVGVDEGRHGVGGAEGDEHGEDRAADRGAPAATQPVRLGEHRLDRGRQHDHLVGRPLQQGRRSPGCSSGLPEGGDGLGRGQGGPRRDQAGLDPRGRQAGRGRRSGARRVRRSRTAPRRGAGPRGAGAGGPARGRGSGPAGSSVSRCFAAARSLSTSTRCTYASRSSARRTFDQSVRQRTSASRTTPSASARGQPRSTAVRTRRGQRVPTYSVNSWSRPTSPS